MQAPKLHKLKIMQKGIFTIVLLVLSFIISSCSTSQNEKIKGYVVKSEWYVSSIGFSSGGGNGYYKQKIEYTYIIDGEIFTGGFNNGPAFGHIYEGDSLLLEYNQDKPNESTVISKIKKKGRKKNKPVKGIPKQSVD